MQHFLDFFSIVITKRNALDTIDNQRLLLMLERRTGVHSRILLEVTKSLAFIKNKLMRYNNPIDNPDVGINPLLNESLRKFLPFTDDHNVNAFFDIGDDETIEDTRERLLLLQRYILGTTLWNPSTFVYRMVRLICSKDYRRTHFYPGKSK